MASIVAAVVTDSDNDMIGQELLTRIGVPPEEQDNCIRWAFGQDITEDTPWDAAFAHWNKKHGKRYFPLSLKDDFELAVMGIGRAYLEANFVKRSEN